MKGIGEVTGGESRRAEPQTGLARQRGCRKISMESHPLTGPVFVAGAEPGDLLVAETLEVIPEAFGLNSHIEDVTDLYVELLEIPKEKIAGEAFNAGYENHTVAQLAEFVKKVVEDEFPEKAPIELKTTTSDDNRSYHVSSRKIADKLGWKPKRTIEDAVRDLCRAFKEGKFRDSMTEDNYVNVRAVKKLQLR